MRAKIAAFIRKWFLVIVFVLVYLLLVGLTLYFGIQAERISSMICIETGKYITCFY